MWAHVHGRPCKLTCYACASVAQTLDKLGSTQGFKKLGQMSGKGYGGQAPWQCQDEDVGRSVYRNSSSMRCCSCCVAGEGSTSSVFAAQFDGQGRVQSQPEQGRRLRCPPRPSGHLCKIPGATPEPQPATAGARLGLLGHCRCGALRQVSLEALSDTAMQSASGIGGSLSIQKWLSSWR